jgi:hypothetical protein
MAAQTQICQASGTLCFAGTLTPANPPSYSDYGAGIGVNLSVSPDGGATNPAVQLSGTGVTVKVNTIPAGGLRVQVVVPSADGGASTTYCANLTSTTNGTSIPWTMFNTTCWTTGGVALTGAPETNAIQVAIPSTTAPDGSAGEPFSFCVESITLQ